MSKVDEAKDRLKIAELEAKIFNAERRPTPKYLKSIEKKNNLIASGGRTYQLTRFVSIAIPFMTISYFLASYFISKELTISYIPLLVGCGCEVLVLLFWINRKSRLTEINGPGDVGATFGTKAINQQKPSRRRSETFAGMEIEEHRSIVEDSESSLKESS